MSENMSIQNSKLQENDFQFYYNSNKIIVNEDEMQIDDNNDSFQYYCQKPDKMELFTYNNYERYMSDSSENSENSINSGLKSA